MELKQDSKTQVRIKQVLLDGPLTMEELQGRLEDTPPKKIGVNVFWLQQQYAVYALPETIRTGKNMKYALSPAVKEKMKK